MNDKKIPVVIDCDPGADDALAILLALSSPKLDVVGITTLCGNGPAEQMAKNAAKVCAMAGRLDIPVYIGAEQPMERRLKFTTLYCGEDGLCESGLCEHNELISKIGAGDFFAGLSEPVTVLATAGLTNLAQVLTNTPKAAEHIREIVFAGGYFRLNPKPDRAEWNVLVDPEAAQVVFASGIPMRCVGLDVTNCLENAFVEQLLHETDGRVHDFVKACIDYDRRVGLSAYSILVDGMAVAAVMEPEMVSYVRGRVQIHPDRTDAGLMEFHPCDDGNVLAAGAFAYDTYLSMMKEMMK